MIAGNECVGSEALTYCYDRTATNSFIFSLAGGHGSEPTRYSATGADTHFVYANYNTWPAFGASEGSDLSFGSGGAPGVGGTCSHVTGSTTYATSPDALHGVCGAPGDWSTTDLEVWHVEDEYLADHYSNEDAGVAIEGGAGHIHHTAFPCLDGCCASGPCQNGGRCEETAALDAQGAVVREYVCQCLSGYDGSECDHALSGSHTGGKGR